MSQQFSLIAINDGGRIKVLPHATNPANFAHSEIITSHLLGCLDDEKDLTKRKVVRIEFFPRDKGGRQVRSITKTTLTQYPIGIWDMRFDDSITPLWASKYYGRIRLQAEKIILAMLDNKYTPPGVYSVKSSELKELCKPIVPTYDIRHFEDYSVESISNYNSAYRNADKPILLQRITMKSEGWAEFYMDKLSGRYSGVCSPGFNPPRVVPTIDVTGNSIRDYFHIFAPITKGWCPPKYVAPKEK